MGSVSDKFTVLHIGEDIKYNPDYYKQFASKFTIIQPSHEERQRNVFVQNLKDRKWGDFHAVFRPFWNSGGEMGKLNVDAHAGDRRSGPLCKIDLNFTTPTRYRRIRASPIELLS